VCDKTKAGLGGACVTDIFKYDLDESAVKNATASSLKVIQKKTLPEQGFLRIKDSRYFY
jgi:hypothetical protein